MKNKIRKWLGIESIEESLRERVHPSDAQLRKMVGEAIEAALNGCSDEDWSPWGFRPGIKNTLTSALESASLECATKQAKWEIAQRIDNEAFLDEVVARIQRKQV